MAKQEILNLDKFVPEPRIVRLEGKEYKVASDISVEDALKIMQKWTEYQEEDGGSNSSQIETLLEQIWKFFEGHNPDLTKEELKSKIRVRHIGPLVDWLYQGIMEFSGGSDVPVDEESSSKKKETQSE